MVSKRTPYHPTVLTVYVYKVYLFTQERGERGRVEPERKGEGKQGRMHITKQMYARN
jgi:hypothetical protein